MDKTTSKCNKGKNGQSKVDPSFKSKRYRDKLRTEVKSLESLLPVDRPTLHRKLDSQTVYRLAIAYLRIKSYFTAIGFGKKTSQWPIESEDSSGKGQHTNHESPSADGTNTQGSSAIPNILEHITDSQVYQSAIVNQILDGFILVASVDGSVMYVSENILQFNGFNQVDLKHRCLYGAIHPDDQMDVKKIIENNGAFSYQQTFSPMKPSVRKKQKTKADDTDCVPLSFFCRMKCFSGNTAGYVKLHCTGKIQSVSNIKRTPKTSDKVILLYCKPFMLNGSDITHEAKQNVFWSKHDLDLKLKDIETKSSEATGYDEHEVRERSMYEFVHPEDLCVLAHVHKLITEINEVQSFYFRFLNKDGGCIWLHSKGKVICKNSKKFSIVFTHCPIRDEDSIFIQQEVILRQRYGFTDLCNMYQYKSTEVLKLQNEQSSPHSTNHARSSNSQVNDSTCYQNNSYHDFMRNTRDIHTLGSPICLLSSACPSSWHADTDRHSPLVPSSHVAHKLSLREKQLHLADLRRKQERNEHTSTELYHVNELQREFNSQFPALCAGNTQYETKRPCDRSLNNDSILQNYSNPYARYSSDQYRMERQFCYTNYVQSKPYNYPPSPPPSPRNTNQVHSHPTFHQPSFEFPNHFIPNNRSFSTLKPMGYLNNHVRCNYQSMCIQPAEQMIGIPSGGKCNNIDGHIEKYYFQARDQDYHSSQMTSLNGNVSVYNDVNRETSESLQSLHMKVDPEISQSCARLNYCSPRPREIAQYDVNMSLHMKIVEGDIVRDKETTDFHIPVIESFIEYLNTSND